MQVLMSARNGLTGDFGVNAHSPTKTMVFHLQVMATDQVKIINMMNGLIWMERKLYSNGIINRIHKDHA
jgi:hypothetical protein